MGSQTGGKGRGGSTTWEKFPHFPVFLWKTSLSHVSAYFPTFRTFTNLPELPFWPSTWPIHLTYTLIYLTLPAWHTKLTYPWILCWGERVGSQNVCIACFKVDFLTTCTNIYVQSLEASWGGGMERHLIRSQLCDALNQRHDDRRIVPVGIFTDIIWKSICAWIQDVPKTCLFKEINHQGFTS